MGYDDLPQAIKDRLFVASHTPPANVMDFDELTTEEIKTEYPELWETAKWHFPILSDEALTTLVSFAFHVRWNWEREWGEE
jgi:hypothetical protein